MFKGYLRHFFYDTNPIDAEVIEVKEEAAWTRKKVIFNGTKSEDIFAYLCLSRQLINPLQCMIFVPGAGVFFVENLAEMAEGALAPLIKSGRAILTVVLKGMIVTCLPDIDPVFES